MTPSARQFIVEIPEELWAEVATKSGLDGGDLSELVAAQIEIYIEEES
jgi:hypothetical protein